MGYISKLLGQQEQINYLISSETDNFPKQLSIKATPKVVRVDPNELEQAYLSDSVTFGSINKITQLIMSAGYSWEGKNENVKKYFVDFFKNIGKVGEDITEEEIFTNIFQFLCIYGNAYVELVFNKNLTKIVDICLPDPKRMDYARDSNGNIAVDDYGKPVGYVLKCPWDIKINNKGDDLPKNVVLSDNSIFISSQKICHFKLYTFGDRFSGVGLIEPSYKTILNKLNIENANTHAIVTRGLSPIIAYVGDELHQPSAQQMEKILTNMTKLNSNRYQVYPYWVKLTPLEIKQSDIIQNTLDYLRINQTASSSLPSAFALGSGVDTNKSVLYGQQRFLEFTIRDIIKRVTSTFRKYIIRRIAKYNLNIENDDDLPYVKWGNVSTEEINDKANRLINYVDKGILSSSDIINYVKKTEDL